MACARARRTGVRVHQWRLKRTVAVTYKRASACVHAFKRTSVLQNFCTLAAVRRERLELRQCGIAAVHWQSIPRTSVQVQTYTCAGATRVAATTSVVCKRQGEKVLCVLQDKRAGGTDSESPRQRGAALLQCVYKNKHKLYRRTRNKLHCPCKRVQRLLAWGSEK